MFLHYVASRHQLQNFCTGDLHAVGGGSHIGNITVGGSATVTSVSIAGTLAGNLSIPAAGSITLSGMSTQTGDISLTGAGPHTGSVIISIASYS